MPNQRATGIKISGKTIEATNTYGIVIVPGKFNVLTRIVTAPFRALGALLGGRLPDAAQPGHQLNVFRQE